MWIKECLVVFWRISHHFAWEKKKANVHLTPLDSLEILVKSKIMRDAVSLKATKPDFSKT
jgi:hypothetical protein